MVIGSCFNYFKSDLKSFFNIVLPTVNLNQFYFIVGFGQAKFFKITLELLDFNPISNKVITILLLIHMFKEQKN